MLIGWGAFFDVKVAILGVAIHRFLVGIPSITHDAKLDSGLYVTHRLGGTRVYQFWGPGGECAAGGVPSASPAVLVSIWPQVDLDKVLSAFHGKKHFGESWAVFAVVLTIPFFLAHTSGEVGPILRIVPVDIAMSTVT